jgi:cephalosporin hydroxylase
MTPVLAPAEGVDIPLSVRMFGTPPPGVIGIEKDHHDLMRYTRVIALTSPDVLIECGTNTGYSANWFAQRVPRVITIDCDISRVVAPHPDNVTRILGSSIDPDLVWRVAEEVRGQRVMVSLDSDHRPGHVAREIFYWADVATEALVIEDGIYHWIQDPHHPDWDPWRAIVEVMPQLPQFERDLRTEAAYPITGSPAGWWLKRRD